MHGAFRNLATCSILCLTVALQAESVQLRDGRVLEGKIIRKANIVTIVAGDRIYQFEASKIADDGDAASPQPETEAAEENVTVNNPVIKIKTAKGDLTAELFEDKCPNTVANIVALAESGFYKGLTFHRLIPGFMAQGGCPNSRPGAAGAPGTGGPGYRIADEFHPDLKHNTSGLLSMANSGPNTNGSQFFITLKATPWLDDKHTIFGKVTAGREVLQALEAAGTESGKPREQIEFDIQVISKGNHPYTVEKL